MVGTRDTMARQQIPRQGTQAALHAVASDRAADFLGHGITGAQGRFAVAARVNEQNETGGNDTTTFIGREIVAPQPKRFERRQRASPG